MKDIGKMREAFVQSIVEGKGPWLNKKDRAKATHALQIMFNTLYKELRPEEYEQYQNSMNLVFKTKKARIEQ